MLDTIIDVNKILGNVNKLLENILKDDDIPLIIRADILSQLDNLGRIACVKGDCFTQVFGERYSVQDVIEAISTTTDKAEEYYSILEWLVTNGIRRVIKIY